MSKELLCIDVVTPRIDGRHKELTGLTLGKTYKSLGSTERYMVRIINDDGKAANYMKIRFEEVLTPDRKESSLHTFQKLYGEDEND